MSHRVCLGLMFWGATLFWFLLYAFISPEFAGIDVYIFKEAGVNWALGKGFVAALLPGNRGPDPLLYASYPPLYPFLFGIYSKIFGVGAYQNTFFNLSLAWICALLWFQLMKSFFQPWQGSRSSYLFVGILCFLIPRALLGADRDRPDNLSLALFLGSILLSTREMNPKRWRLIFLLCGLNGIVSPFGALMHFFSLLILHRKKLFKLTNLRQTGSTLFYTALPLTLVVILYAIWDPQFLNRFLDHSTKGDAGIGLLTRTLRDSGLSAYFKVIYSIVISSHPPILVTNLSYLITWILLTVYFLLKFFKQKNQEYLTYWFFLLGMGLLPLILFPTQTNYFVFTRDILLAGMLYYGIREEKVTKTLIRLISVVLITIFCTQMPFVVRDIAIRVNNHTSYYRALNAANHLNSLILSNPTQLSEIQTKVGVWPSLYFIFKPKVNLVDLYWLPINQQHLLKFLVLGFAESGNPMEPVLPPGITPPAVSEIIYTPLLPQPTTILGKKISRSSNTWEGLIYANPNFRKN